MSGEVVPLLPVLASASGLVTLQRHALLVLDLYARTGMPWPTTSEVARDMGITGGPARRHLRALAERGLVVQVADHPRRYRPVTTEEILARRRS